MAEPGRLGFTTGQAAVLRHVMADAPTRLRTLAERAARNQVLSDEDAEALVAALTDEMLRDYTEEDGLSARGKEIDDLIGIANQLAESFYRQDDGRAPETVWVFHGNEGRFSGGAFTTRELAETWIHEHRLTGVLTAYPLDTGAYDWAVRERLFAPTKPHHSTPSFIGGFTSASQDHFHYEDGQPS